MKNEIRECLNCKKSFLATSKNWEQKFCSYKCNNNGKFSTRWNGGKYIDSYGYIHLKNRNHPYADKQGYVSEHRLVLEENLGRYLLPLEVVHHMNGLKTDNRIENLKILSSSQHRKIHNLENNPFLGKHHSEAHKKYISDVMRNFWKVSNKRVNFKCMWCNKNSFKPKCYFDRAKKHFCSRSCSDEFQRRLV